ncbi:pyruvate:ferredoxin (flavodoxin) oxidoreductase [Sediminitomix flava]|nr:pyruvate:ferredoxin (flavodoxin) oxidoreductase [Sediminitomix flava]
MRKIDSTTNYITLDGNEAVASVAYKVNEVCAIYPITPSSSLGEKCDEWAAKGVKNIWGNVPSVMEMQSEGGAAGTVHGSLQAGALTTTFTASQGLLLKIPNMYKIAGELTPAVFHVTARSLATHALSIFNDHSDVMAARQTGFAMLASSSVQEAMDTAIIAHAATLKARIPFMHFYDGFRTSHEISKINPVSDDIMRQMIDEEYVRAHRERALTPDRPKIRGTAQNPDVYFQSREGVNTYYADCPYVVQEYMDRFAKLTGRQYKVYEYEGAEDAEHVIVAMASATETIKQTVDYFNAKGQKVGVLKVRLYRPFDTKLFMEALPATVKKISVLDRTKEPGASAEPLCQDVAMTLLNGIQAGYGTLKQMPMIIGGRFGLSSKEFTPSMAKSVFDNLFEEKPKNNFTVGILDDVTNTSLTYDPNWDIEPDNLYRALFYGLGSDGTVGANKNTIKIIGENTPNYAQGYFVYDSKKAGSMTVSHLRFGPDNFQAPYLINTANFVACHQFVFLEKKEMLNELKEGGIFLLNTPFGKDELWDQMPRKVQEQIIRKKIKVFAIDAQKVAEESGMKRRINTIMQTCFFAISEILPREEAINAIKDAIHKTYGKKGDKIVNMNITAVDNTLDNLFELEIPAEAKSQIEMQPPVSENAPDFVDQVLGKIIAGFGDDVPVSALPEDGTFPVGTAAYEKRNIALEIPVWDMDPCIQCGKCAAVCPHAAIRIKAFEKDAVENAPSTFKHTSARDKDFKADGLEYSIQIAPEDCTGCYNCVEVCPAMSKEVEGRKSLYMQPQLPLKQQEKENWDFFLSIPELDRSKLKNSALKQQQLQQPLFEFSGACAGCGETPYIKMLTQLFGDRALVANATGCSSIFSGNLPTTPYTTNADGRGPAWSNSLFEDNAEFGLGFRLAVDEQTKVARELVSDLKGEIGEELSNKLLSASQDNEIEIFEQRERIEEVKSILSQSEDTKAKRLLDVADYLAKKSIWIVGGDGWAYDIGYGGLDHVLSTGKNVNILVLDTEVYSNTGGQASKSTPLGAIAKFATNGKRTGKKDLGAEAMAHGGVYVATIAYGANDNQTLKAFLEAEAYDGPSIIIAYAHCIEHGIDMNAPLAHHKALVDSGQWILYRYNPERENEGKNPLILDSKPKQLSIADFMQLENRFRMLAKNDPSKAKELAERASKEAGQRYRRMKHLAEMEFEIEVEENDPSVSKPVAKKAVRPAIGGAKKPIKRAVIPSAKKVEEKTEESARPKRPVVKRPVIGKKPSTEVEKKAEKTETPKPARPRMRPKFKK